MADKGQPKDIAAGYQPVCETTSVRPEGVIQKGYQPQASARPEGQNPPSGGSNVTPPQQSAPPSKQQ
jgi:hypothetical protein